MKSLPIERYSIPILWLALLAFFILAAAIYQPIQPNDYWWYVRIGQETVEQGAVPAVDTLSYTQAGQPIVYHSWLSAIVFWLIHTIGGPALTLLLRGGLLVLTYTAVWLTCRQTGASVQIATVIALVAAFAGSNNWAMRPQLLAYPLFAFSLLLLWRWGKGETRGLWLLPLLMIVWVNVHGSFVLGFLLVGAALVGGPGDRRALLGPFLAMFLATLANPRAFGAWSYVVSLLTDTSSQQFSVEWRPPSNESWPEQLFFGWLLLFGLLAALSPRKLRLTHWLWFLGFGWLALSGIRYVIWFLLILAPITAHLVTPFIAGRFDKPPQTIRPAFNGLITLLLLLLPLALLPQVRHSWWPEAPDALSHTTPVAATEWLAQHPDLPGPLWSDLAFASYLVYALPERPVWNDTRFELYPPEQWERYLEIATAAPGWQEILDEESISLLFISPQNQPRLHKELQNGSDWCLRYQDEQALIYTRKPGGESCPPPALERRES